MSSCSIIDTIESRDNGVTICTKILQKLYWSFLGSTFVFRIYRKQNGMKRWSQAMVQYGFSNKPTVDTSYLAYEAMYSLTALILSHLCQRRLYASVDQPITGWDMAFHRIGAKPVYEICWHIFICNLESTFLCNFNQNWAFFTQGKASEMSAKWPFGVSPIVLLFDLCHHYPCCNIPLYLFML